MTGSRRTVPLPTGWRAIRHSILERDVLCQWGQSGISGEDGECAIAAAEVDHIGAAWDHRPEVLRGICSPHHLIRTSIQANAAKTMRHSLRYRPTEKHPGLKRGPE